MHYFCTIAFRVTSNTSRGAFTHLYLFVFIFCWQYLMTFLNCKISYSSHLKRQQVCLCRVWIRWIRLIIAYLLCARELWQNNALLFQFWYLSNALALPVRALEASKSQRACNILSQFTRKSKYVYSYKFIHINLPLRSPTPSPLES